MLKNNDLASLGEGLSPFNDSFNQFVQPYRASLWNYCHRLTGSPWDAEDLLQETMLKAFASLSRIKQSIHPKSYLFRICSNTWIDQCRRNKVKMEELELENVFEVNPVSYQEISEAIETLIHLLPAKQASVILLMDAYKFTSIETADIIGSTEGAVYALRNRARANLKKWQKQNSEVVKSESLSPEKEKMIKLYMDSFVKGDFKAIGDLLADYATNEVVGQGMDIGKKQIRSNSMGDWASGGSEPTLIAQMVTLWGKHAVVYTKKTEKEPVLWDITSVEIEDGKIVKHKSYYFCKEFLRQAAKELHIRLDEEKDLFGAQW